MLVMESKLRNVTPEMRQQELSPYQAGIEQALQNAQVGYPSPSWDELQSILGGPLSRLVQDHFNDDAVLPPSSLRRLSDLADQLQLPSADVLLGLAERALNAPVTP